MKNTRETELVVCSNMLNEIDMLRGMEGKLEDWYTNFSRIADGGIIIVDDGSTDGTLEYFRELGALIIDEAGQVGGENPDLIVVVDNIIQREGYGPARNHLRSLVKQHFPEAGWFAFFDADERIDEAEAHYFRHMKDTLIDDFDVIGFPRIDWKPDGTMAKEYTVNPDWQARMSRMSSPIRYVRKLHEQITGHRQIFTNIENPKINHFHRIATAEKRNHVGKVCAYLHGKDEEYGKTYPEHHKEAHYRELIKKEGLN